VKVTSKGAESCAYVPSLPNICSNTTLPDPERATIYEKRGQLYTRSVPSLLERLTADLKDAMRAGDALRRDEIRGLIAMLKAEQQSKLTRVLSKQGLILHGDNAE